MLEEIMNGRLEPPLDLFDYESMMSFSLKKLSKLTDYYVEDDKPYGDAIFYKKVRRSRAGCALDLG